MFDRYETRPPYGGGGLGETRMNGGWPNGRWIGGIYPRSLRPILASSAAKAARRHRLPVYALRHTHLASALAPGKPGGPSNEVLRLIVVPSFRWITTPAIPRRWGEGGYNPAVRPYGDTLTRNVTNAFICA